MQGVFWLQHTAHLEPVTNIRKGKIYHSASITGRPFNVPLLRGTVEDVRLGVSVAVNICTYYSGLSHLSV
jgi:hypothetical protein